MPATVGYQPTPVTEMAELQDRFVSPPYGDTTSVQAIYAPADDMTDPAGTPSSVTSTPPGHRPTAFQRPDDGTALRESAMSGFVLHLQSATSNLRVEGVTSFVGADDCGSFGILPQSAPFMTCLSFGLARYLLADGNSRFVALQDAVLYFRGGELTVSTRRFVEGRSYGEVHEALARLSQLATDARSKCLSCLG